MPSAAVVWLEWRPCAAPLVPGRESATAQAGTQDTTQHGTRGCGTWGGAAVSPRHRRLRRQDRRITDLVRLVPWVLGEKLSGDVFYEDVHRLPAGRDVVVLPLPVSAPAGHRAPRARRSVWAYPGTSSVVGGLGDVHRRDGKQEMFGLHTRPLLIVRDEIITSNGLPAEFHLLEVVP
ncbi:hypothetical protein GCM10027028_11570 [Streptomyces sundarbansensis]